MLFYLTCVRMGRLRPGLKSGNWSLSHSPASHTLLVCSHLAPSLCREGKVFLHCHRVKKSAGIFVEQLDCNLFFFKNKCNVKKEKKKKRKNKKTQHPPVKNGNAWAGCPPWQFKQSALDFRVEFPEQGKRCGAGRKRLSFPLVPTGSGC